MSKPYPYSHYIEEFIGALNSFVKENLGSLRGVDLANFYSDLLVRLRRTFGGAWGFNGVTEFLILRSLYYLAAVKYGEEPQRVSITRDLTGFHYRGPDIVLSAGRPLRLPGTRRNRIWPDIVVYKPGPDPSEVKELFSVIEVKAYPPSIRDIDERVVQRFEQIRSLYGDANYALIVYIYTAKRRNTRMQRYLRGEEVDGKSIPDYIDAIVLSNDYRKLRDILYKYI